MGTQAGNRPAGRYFLLQQKQGAVELLPAAYRRQESRRQMGGSGWPAEAYIHVAGATQDL